MVFHSILLWCMLFPLCVRDIGIGSIGIGWDYNISYYNQSFLIQICQVIGVGPNYSLVRPHMMSVSQLFLFPYELGALHVYFMQVGLSV